MRSRHKIRKNKEAMLQGVSHMMSNVIPTGSILGNDDNDDDGVTTTSLLLLLLLAIFIMLLLLFWSGPGLD
jgi:hypothetical protein